ncbi:MAG: (d)CMP kinase [Deltaproteobacteria bacterium]|nr:MAG: (d)CMP kinase [Deltaproteobacteria bacterium]
MSLRVVAVDGPAGAGKSTASRALARRLGFTHVDTGAMYRAVGVLARERGIELDDDDGLGVLVAGLSFEIAGERLLVGGRDLSEAIRRAEAGELASRVAARPVVRTRLVPLQRALARPDGIVMEGRDIGTVVFPEAPAKLYLTAAPAERARRRAVELRARGETVDETALARELAERDRRDSERAHSPLRPARDAVVLDTTTLALEAVVDEMERIARARLSLPAR